MITAASASTSLIRISPNSIKSNRTSDVAGAKTTGEFVSLTVSSKISPQGALPQNTNWDHYNSLTNVGTTQEELVRPKTEGGRKLSESQGLPEGHYDFSRMSRAEMNVALNDIILNKRAPQVVVDGLTTMANTMPERHSDLFKQAKDSIEFEAGEKNTVIADMLKAALAYISADKALFPSTKECSLAIR